MQKISIFGIGRWGTLLAWYLRERGHDILLWGRNQEKVERLRSVRKNQYVRLHREIKITSDIEFALNFSDTMIVSILSKGFRSFCITIQDRADFRRKRVVSTMKGVDPVTLKRMSETAQSLLKIGDFAVLGGPGHAEDIAAGKKTCLVVASHNEKLMDVVSRLIHSNTIRIYKLDDITGVELSGAFKNVVGIASGICDGMDEFGLKASLIARSMAEIKRLGARCGANVETFNGLSLVGDFCVTCFGPYSKNRKVGELIAQGRPLSDINISAEGITSAQSFFELSKKYRVEMPICDQVYNILYRNYPVKKALDILWERPLKREYE